MNCPYQIEFPKFQTILVVTDLSFILMGEEWSMIKNGFLTEKEKMMVERFSSMLKSALGKNLILVKLIGSKVKGDFGSESDIDILIIVKDYLSDKEKVIDILYNIDPYFEVKISPVIYSEFEYEKNKELESPFIIKAEKDGVNL